MWVWHDGEFPFDDSRKPAFLHHCMPEQFIEFGEFVLELPGMDRNGEESDEVPKQQSSLSSALDFEARLARQRGGDV